MKINLTHLFFEKNCAPNSQVETISLIGTLT